MLKSQFDYFLWILSCLCLLFIFFCRNFGGSPWIFKSSWYIRIINSSHVLYVANIFSYFYHLPFDFAYNSFWLIKVGFCFIFILRGQIYSAFILLHLDFGVTVRKPFSEIRSQRKWPSLGSTLVWFHFSHFRDLIHLKFSFGYDVKNRNIFFYKWLSSFLKTSSIKPIQHH